MLELNFFFSWSQIDWYQYLTRLSIRTHHLVQKRCELFKISPIKSKSLILGFCSSSVLLWRVTIFTSSYLKTGAEIHIRIGILMLGAIRSFSAILGANGSQIAVSQPRCVWTAPRLHFEPEVGANRCQRECCWKNAFFSIF